MKFQPLHIGQLKIDFPVLLAPMAGFTDYAFRSICIEHGAGLVLTEMVNAMGIVRRQPHTLHYLETLPLDRPVGAHIYGSDPAVMAAAAAHIESLNQFDFIDINAGCPVPKIMRRGDGAGLLKDPSRMAAVVKAVREAVRMPVTIKTRIGLSSKACNISEVAQAVEEAGANALFLHARFANVRHAGLADWEMLARIKSERKIPVVGNGGIAVATDVERMIQSTGVDGVMIGRAALGNPWIFQQIRALSEHQIATYPSPAERRAVIVTHLERLTRLAEMEAVYRKRMRQPASSAACLLFRAHIVRYARGFAGFRELAQNLQKLETLEQLMAMVDQVLATEWRRSLQPVDPDGKT
jgi:tRNA-dihydrouridine synthase B